MTDGVLPWPHRTPVYGETGRAFEMKSMPCTDTGTHGEGGSIGTSLEYRRHPPVEITPRDGQKGRFRR
jgi:hypothetical protein